MKKLQVLMLILMLVTLSACRAEPSAKTPSLPTEVHDDAMDSQPEEERVSVTLYYANYDFIMTGDASSGQIIPVEKYVSAQDRSIEEAIVSELQKEPEEETLTTLLADLNILSVDTNEKIAYVNIAGEELSGGSLMESVILSQLVYSLTELEDIEAVQLLVDGSVAESFMGHMEIQKPLTREEVLSLF